MLSQHAEELEKKEMSEDQREAAAENLKHRTADVDLCFAKYYIYIIKTSIERLLQEDEELKYSKNPTEFKLDESFIKFPLNLDIYERDVADSFVLTFEDAKEVFLSAQSHLNKAKEYYSLANEASQYSRIVQDHALLFKHLAFFESDPSTQAKLQKRRIDQLEDVQKELNPTYYMNICRYEKHYIHKILIQFYQITEN
jgi:predicted DNA-binding protein (MmcQ/YjbR family)